MSGAIRPGEKLPSENELSQKYSLSRHTVRKALGILEQDGYVEAFHGRGTYCSENMRHIKNSKNIAVVTTYISDYIFPRLIQGMDNVLSESGYSIILKNTANSRQKEARCLEELLKKDIDGLIIEPSKSEMICKHRNLYQNLDKFELGHKKIKGFFKADDMQGLERHKGYVKALQESGIAYDPDDVVWFHTEDRKVKPALMAKEMVQSGQLPDGIVCYNDQIAVQVMEELEKMGVRIPDDISITGYDNSLYAQRGSGITTIPHPQEKLGEMAAELILEKINGVPEEESKVERLIYPELIIRGSCRKIL